MNAFWSRRCGGRRWTRLPISVAGLLRVGIMAILATGEFMSAWVEGRVAGRRQWSDSLYSLQVDAPQVTFVAGQFARLALPAPPGSKEPMIGRPYSFVNPPTAQPHEFYFIVAARRSAVAAARDADAGESVWLAPRANGFFSIGETRAGRIAVVPVHGNRHRAVPVDAAHRRAVDEVRPRRARALGAPRGGAHVSRRDRRHRARAPRRVRLRADGQPRHAPRCARRAHSRTRSTTAAWKRAWACR